MITRSKHPTNRGLLLVPESDPFDFFVSCGGSDIEQQAICLLQASYPLDPKVKIIARMYYASPPFSFRQVANRLREIAFCLDVTDQLKSDGISDEPELNADGELDDLRACRELIS